MGSENGAKGKRYRPRLYNISFPETSPWADVEAKLKGASVDTLLNLMEVADAAKDVADGSAPVVTQAHRKAVEVMIREFAPLISWWNVDEEVAGENGEEVLRPVPPDEAGVRRQDFALVVALFEAWQDRIALVPPPLPGGSGPGPDQAEGSIPMESLPASHSSS